MSFAQVRHFVNSVKLSISRKTCKCGFQMLHAHHPSEGDKEFCPRCSANAIAQQD